MGLFGVRRFKGQRRGSPTKKNNETLKVRTKGKPLVDFSSETINFWVNDSTRVSLFTKS